MFTDRLLPTRRAIVAVALMALALMGAAVAPAHAQLAHKDFLTTGDKLLVTDATTGFEWLTPVFTKNLVFDAPEVQAIRSTYGFRYATAEEARSMILNNFNPPTAFPGTEDGFEAADAFFALFGVAESIRCKSGEVACPRTQGLTSAVGSNGTAHLAFGMVQYDIWGYMLADNPWPDTSHEKQTGSWLVRPTTIVTTAPEPATVVLLTIGAAGLLLLRRRRARAQLRAQVPTRV